MAFRNSSVTTRASGGSTALNGSAPAGTTAGDYLLAFVNFDGTNADTVTPPAGWTSRRSFGFAAGAPDQSKCEIFDTIATGSDSYAFTTSTNQDAVLIVGAWSGRNTSAPRSFVSTPSTNTSANATPVSVALSSGTAVSGDDIAAFAMLDTTVGTDTWGFSPPGSYTERQDSQIGFAISTLATLDNVSAGAIGTLTFTGTRSAGTGAAGWGGVVIAIAIAASGDTAPQGTNQLDLLQQADWKPERWDYPLNKDLLLDDIIPPASSPGSYTLVAGQGSYTLTGQNVNLRTARRIGIQQGSYTLTGQVAGLIQGHKIGAAFGTYLISGQANNLLASRVLVSEQGTFSLSGQTATLTYSGAGPKTLTAEQGTYTLSGQTLTFKAARSVLASPGAYSLSGTNAGLKPARILTCQFGIYSLIGQDATLTYSGAPPATPGEFGYHVFFRRRHRRS